jgi:adenylosuccinate lyase
MIRKIDQIAETSQNAMSNSPFDRYESPLVTRNASRRMIELFSPRRRIVIWRQLWIALAEAQHALGLNITKTQIAQLKRAVSDIDFAKAAAYEKKTRHDVMAHIHAYGDVAPKAKSIIHLGATSAFIVDNADLIILREALTMVRDWLVNVIDALAAFAKKYKSMPALGLTHYQPAQPTTVGKRAACWCYDFVRDYEEISWRLEQLKFRGVKGTTGTQASFLALFDGNAALVKKLEKMVAKSFGFDRIEPVTGQTYSRKVDAQAVQTLAGIATSVHKFSNDIRLLAHAREIEEPFESDQVGSSAMAYKRNPMRCERATALARFVISISNSPVQTAAEQWLERTLDDSANKRIAIPESFLATDGMLKILTNVARGLIVYPKVVAARLSRELPFMATENILMAAVRAGGDRQRLHEKIRAYSHAASARIKEEGLESDLLQRIATDPEFSKVDLSKVVNPKAFIGLAPQQVTQFLTTYITPIRRKHRQIIGVEADLAV